MMNFINKDKNLSKGNQNEKDAINELSNNSKSNFSSIIPSKMVTCVKCREDFEVLAKSNQSICDECTRDHTHDSEIIARTNPTETKDFLENIRGFIEQQFIDMGNQFNQFQQSITELNESIIIMNDKTVEDQKTIQANLKLVNKNLKNTFDQLYNKYNNVVNKTEKLKEEMIKDFKEAVEKEQKKRAKEAAKKPSKKSKGSKK